LRHGAQFDEIGQIGLKPALAIRCYFPKTADLQTKKTETQKGIENPRSGDKISGLAPLAKSFRIVSTKKITQLIEQISVM